MKRHNQCNELKLKYVRGLLGNAKFPKTRSRYNCTKIKGIKRSLRKEQTALSFLLKVDGRVVRNDT